MFWSTSLLGCLSLLSQLLWSVGSPPLVMSYHMFPGSIISSITTCMFKSDFAPSTAFSFSSLFFFFCTFSFLGQSLFQLSIFLQTVTGVNHWKTRRQQLPNASSWLREQMKWPFTDQTLKMKCEYDWSLIVMNVNYSHRNFWIEALEFLLMPLLT